MARNEKLYEAILRGDHKAAAQCAREALDAGADPEDLIKESMVPAMDEIGKRFEVEECYVPELLISARAMKAALDLVRPLLAGAQARGLGRVVIGTVAGDLHDIGKNIVGSMLEGGGFEVVDLGSNVPPAAFVHAVEQHQPQIIGLSALLTTTMPAMKTVIDALEAARVRDRVKVMVGGAPVSSRYAEAIGADAYGPDARAAVVAARRLVGS